jgi:hypothetical protein
VCAFKSAHGTTYADKVHRQVQDLQSQLAELRQENSHLRTRTSDRSSMDIDRGPTPIHQAESQMFAPSHSQRLQPPVLGNFETVRRNIRIQSHGLFTPQAGQGRGASSSPNDCALPELPPRADFARLSRKYLDSIHEIFPILHWTTFQNEADRVYTLKSFDSMTKEWVGLFFAVLACGAVHNPTASPGAPVEDNKGRVYFEIATQAMMPYPQDVTVTSTRLALLLSIFAVEGNLKSVGSSWLAVAVRAAQTLGLHVEVGRSTLEGEMQRRLWWSLYVWDRLVW